MDNDLLLCWEARFWILSSAVEQKMSKISIPRIPTTGNPTVILTPKARVPGKILNHIDGPVE